MAIHHSLASAGLRRAAISSPALVGLLALPLHATLLNNLQWLPERVRVGDPSVTATDGQEGPKSIATADFNGDGRPDLAVGNLDGTITVLIRDGDGFAPPLHLRTGAVELRGILAADLNGDGRPDLAAASPMDGQLMVYFNPGGGDFGARNLQPKTLLPAWIGVRSLASGDFDGDGIADLAAAGPGFGVRHFRGTGGGAFEIMGDLTRLSPVNQDLTHPRPVYALRTLRSRDGRRDDLLVTHADSPALWILSTQPVDRRAEPPVNPTSLPSWKNNPAPVLIHEVQVLNSHSLLDADGTAQPWVELLNKSSEPVNLSGWSLRLKTEKWTLPPVTVEPGRFLTVFLSGKNRPGGPELHASFLLKQSSDALNLFQPNGERAHTIDLPKHTVADVSRGLAPDRDAVMWFDIPSPGAENNAGLANLDDVAGTTRTALTIFPRHPEPGEGVTVTVTMAEAPPGIASLRNVWFSASPGPAEEHHLMHLISPGVYREVLPPGAFTGDTPHRVLARLRDGQSNDYTVEIHPGLDAVEAAVTIGPRPGCLQPVASVPSPKVKSFETGAVTTPASRPGAQPDLVYADEEGGQLCVHRAAPGARRFEPMASQELQIHDSARDVKLADTDRDGWLDATVVLRTFDLAVTCRNERGHLRATREVPTGRSPRELVMADFSGDGRPDAAVVNRESADVSILPTADDGSGLVSLDQIYAVDGGVAALIVRDVNLDGRADVIQLHRASGEISIRYAQEDGQLSQPDFTSLGAYGSSAITIEDVNHDGRPDVLSANLGRDSVGSISVLLAGESGGFAPPLTFHARGALFAIAVADFNNDGHPDVVAGLFDCRLEFFSGNGTGHFTDTYDAPLPAVFEPRVMVTGDFNQDGDIDIAMAGYAGDMVTFENTGAASLQSWIKRTYPPPADRHYGTERIALGMINADSDPDLVIGTGHGVLLYQGGHGMDFTLVPVYAPNAGTTFRVSDVLTGDITGDGAPDMVEACLSAACVNILSQRSDGRFVSMLQVAVPASRFIATGDLDGDGKLDLVGTGDSLWTVLSSRTPLVATPTGLPQADRLRLSQIVINEILARNTGVPVVEDNDRKTDFIELYNGTGTVARLGGWKIRVQSTQEGVPQDETWTLPEISLGAGAFAVILCAESAVPLASGSMQTGFDLPAEGGIVTLLKPDNTEADAVNYPHAQENVSWSRFLDGHPAFHANPLPSPGRSNLDNGRVPPEVKLTPPSPAHMAPGTALTFTARGRAYLGIVSMSLLWNRLDAPLPAPQRTVLYDDGAHGDGAMGDGLFAGQLPPVLPAGAEVEFYLEAVDLSGEVLLLPDGAKLTGRGDSPFAWTFSLTPRPPLEIVEVCTDNTIQRRDETGGHPDYIRVRNTGSQPLDLSRIRLAKSVLDDESLVYAYPPGFMLPPGEEATVFADGNAAEGPLHAPFSFDARGEDVSLFSITPSGARAWIQTLAVPAMATDSRFMQLPGSARLAVVTPTADLTHWVGTSYDGDGIPMATAHFLAAAGTSYTIEGNSPDQPATWNAVTSLAGDNAVHTVIRALSDVLALRIIPSTGLPVPRVDAVIPAVTTAGIYGRAVGAATVTLFYGLTDANTDALGWDFSVASAGTSIQFVPSGLTANTRYFYRLRADTTAGEVWSAGGASFMTLASTTPVVAALTLTRLNATDATVEVEIDPFQTLTAPVILAGTADAFLRAAWPSVVPATISATGTKWTARLNGLKRETEYFVRASIGGRVSATRLRFRTPNADENLIQNLLITEIMYNPSGPNRIERAAGFESDDFEFIELFNASSEPMDLSGLWFEGIAFDFPPAGAPILPPGGFAVIASNPHAFVLRYGTVPLAGWTLHPFRNSRLSNGGELLILHGADGTVLAQIAYTDNDARADGFGYSLEYRIPSGPWGDQSMRDFSSSDVRGSPGRLTKASLLRYGDWISRIPGGQVGNPAAFGGADYDSDGVSNIIEYACGTDPVVPTPDLLTVGKEFINSSVMMSVIFPVNAAPTETLVTLECSIAGLDGWFPVGFIDYLPNPEYVSNDLIKPDLRIQSSVISPNIVSPDKSQVFKTIGIFSNLPPSHCMFRLRVEGR